MPLISNFTLSHTSLAASIVAVATVFSPVLAPIARADEFVSQANQLYADIKPNLRSDLVLLPTLAKLAPAPASVNTLEKSWLLLSGMTGFDEAAAWAAAPSQQAAIQALLRITQATDYRDGYAFGQPYGADNVPVDLVRARLYTELGDPPTLSAAQIMYLPALNSLGILVNVEISRLLGEGKSTEAASLAVAWMHFARQMMDRQFYVEAVWGQKAFIAGCERLRDVVYIDFNADKKLPVEWLLDNVKRFEDPRGLIGMDRIKFPQADYLGAKQLIARCFPPRGKANPDIFASSMASLGSADQPLRLFSEASRWRNAAAQHRDEIDTSRELDQAFGDFRARWALSPFDPRMLQPTLLSQLDRNGYSLITSTLPPMEQLIRDRQVVRTEISGTMQSLATVAYFDDVRAWPPTVSSVRPKYIKEIQADPFAAPNPRSGLFPFFEYFVPVRDTKDRFGPRETPRPHVANIITTGARPNFSAPIGQDQFVLYSLGSDNAKQWADRVQNTSQLVEGADYLIWPPSLSLYRKHLIDEGKLE